MTNSKTALVTGISGTQGGAVGYHLMQRNWHVLGLTRNPGSDRSERMRDAGAELLQADLDDPASWSSQLIKVQAVFLVQALQPKDKEIEQGKKVIDELVKHQVPFVLYSSVLGADLNTGIPHFESKYELEAYLKQSGLDYSIIRPASFYENFLNPAVTQRLTKGKLVMPLKKSTKMQHIGAEDIGKIGAQIIDSADTYKSKTISIATAEHDMEAIRQMFSKAMQREIKYQKLPGLLTRFIMGKDLHKMFSYMNKNDFCILDDIDALKVEFSGLSELEDWIQNQFGQ